MCAHSAFSLSLHSISFSPFVFSFSQHVSRLNEPNCNTQKYVAPLQCNIVMHIKRSPNVRTSHITIFSYFFFGFLPLYSKPCLHHHHHVALKINCSKKTDTTTDKIYMSYTAPLLHQVHHIFIQLFHFAHM